MGVLPLRRLAGIGGGHLIAGPEAHFAPIVAEFGELFTW